MTTRGWRSHFNVSSEQVVRAASPLMIVRVVEGLAAWLFFNEFFLAITPIPWIVQASFVAYFIVNLQISQYYRRGKRSLPLLVTDVLVNVFFLALPVAASGGLASPLLLVFPFKSVHYGMVFGQGMAALFTAATFAMVTLVWAVQLFDLVPVIPLALLGPKLAHSAVKYAVMGILLVVPVTTSWLRWLLGSGQSEARTRAAEKLADTHSAVAGALLRVSETISRLTEIDEILETVVEIAPKSVGVDYCGILLWDEESGMYHGAVASGAGPNLGQNFSSMTLRPDDMPDFEWVRRLGHCVVVSAADTESEHVSSLEVPSMLIAPLLSGHRFYGVMEFARRRGPTGFTQRDLSIADGIARQTAVALQRASLIAESQRLVRAVESSGDGILITDQRGRVAFANRALVRMLGYESEDIVGRQAAELAIGPADWVASVSDSVKSRGWRGEAMGHRKDGSEFPALLDATLIRDDDGTVKGAVAIIRDITEEKKLQEQLHRVDRLAAIGEMGAGIAHEVNNALAVIFAHTKLTDGSSVEELRAALARVDEQSQRIAEIVRGVLGFARPHAPRRTPVDLVEIARKTLDMIAPDVTRRRGIVETEFDTDLPRAQADAQQVQQILLNLLKNALQATPEDRELRLRVEVRGHGDQLVVRVTDSGPGIDAEMQQRIFDPFFSTKDEGSGLGLSVSYAIAQAHGGDLRVESEIGAGSTFTLALPIDQVAVVAEEETGEHFLLIDDDPDVAEALRMMLNAEGVGVEHVLSGDEAFAVLDERDWDAIFLDVRLPGKSGPQIYAEMLESHPRLAQRVVFVTGGIWRSGSPLRDELPDQPILAKPCTQDRLREVLRQVRSLRRDAA
jgi:PAS domain S-box-containing protein